MGRFVQGGDGALSQAVASLPDASLHVSPRCCAHGWPRNRRGCGLLLLRIQHVIVAVRLPRVVGIRGEIVPEIDEREERALEGLIARPRER